MNRVISTSVFSMIALTACSSLPALFDLFSLQLIVSNATEVIAIIINTFIVLCLLR